jgi:hypothetical protein
MFSYIQSLLGLKSQALSGFDSKTPVTIQFQAWLSAFNKLSQQALIDYHTPLTFPYTSANGTFSNAIDEYRMSRMSGGYSIIEVEESSFSLLVVLLQEKEMERFVRVTMEVDVSNTVKKFEVVPIITPLKHLPTNDERKEGFERALQPLTSELRKQIVGGIVGLLEERLPHPEVAAAVILMLRNKLAEGTYECFTSSETFSRQLSKDVQEISKDKQLWISFCEPPRNQPQKRMGFDSFRSTETGLGDVVVDEKTVAGKRIVTLPIGEFIETDDEETLAETGKILSSVADADLVILDIRDCYGANFKKAAFILSYLLPSKSPKEVLKLVDKSGSLKSTILTTPLFPESTPSPSSKPIFILTSPRTSTAGEFLAWRLCKEAKNERDISVIGQGNERTEGRMSPMTHPEFILPEIFGEKWWLIAVPDRKVEGDGWNDGVGSDIVLSEEESVVEVIGKLAQELFSGKWGGVRVLESEEEQEELYK